jgi:putative PIN family toxin of toxin-antitoxin system
VKAVVDTNVIVSGLIWGGPPASLLDRAAMRFFHLKTSEEILVEAQRVLQRPHLKEKLRVRGRTPEGVLAVYREVAEIVTPADVPLPAELRDPEDLLVLRCAVGANAMAIITGDNDLLTMKRFAGIPIMTPRLFLGSIGQ